MKPGTGKDIFRRKIEAGDWILYFPPRYGSEDLFYAIADKAA